jgi:hypothetical protein
MKPLIYFDLCALKRVFDDQSQARIALESSAMIALFQMIHENIITLLSSDALTIENNRNPNFIRKKFIASLLSISDKHIKNSNLIEQNALFYFDKGILLLDALHLTFAEFGKANYFCTCDDKFLVKSKKISKFKEMKIVNPLELIQELL